MIAPVQPLPAAFEKPAVAADHDGSALDEIGVLQRETLGERVTGELRALLVAGRLAPGEKLSLRRVAEALGVSMMPVREAVNRLAVDRALEVLPGRAVRVPLLTLEQFRELTRIRLVVEGFAVEEAARKVTAEQIALVAGHEAAFRKAASSDPPDTAGAVAANCDLHFAIYRASGMPSLVEMIERLWLKAGPVLNLNIRLEPSRLKGGSAVRAHESLLTALQRSDPASARVALEADIKAAAAFVEMIRRFES
ncbi:DNA-binding transcriptional regulator, GntR family [Bosea sp. OK403]|jgi:DNA-binding GntR family transcriptional regulator|uniref:GntR family transcriptional regulator n=1 Tax=Bosea sp. OK403 TaxID=1855286 RepID=UPI0008E27E02|nr:GntR family transcriptional regulator [Bosea sp. OK403]SFJ75340.1 DNA-binding transcriptional regulator, GntR family [Bosea sp. OK403]